MNDEVDQKDTSLRGKYDEKFRSFVVHVSAMQILMEAEPRDPTAIDAATNEAHTAHVAYSQARDAFARSLAVGVRVVERGPLLNN